MLGGAQMRSGSMCCSIVQLFHGQAFFLRLYDVFRVVIGSQKNRVEGIEIVNRPSVRHMQASSLLTSLTRVLHLSHVMNLH